MLGIKLNPKLHRVKYFVLLLSNFISLVFYSQQNFINVPSSEATKRHKLFFQQQINFNELIQSNTTLDFGLRKGFEVGVNVLGLNFNEKTKTFLNNDTSDSDPYNPLVMLNGLKQFELNKKISITIGTQAGLNFNDNKKTKGAQLVYSNLLIKDMFIERSSIVLGSYYNTQHYGGQGNRLGIWLGAEMPIVNKLHVVAESVLGNNAISYTSVGIIYYPKKRIPLTFGMQIPNTKNNAYSFVFELTFVP
jgi:hypothetical protein